MKVKVLLDVPVDAPGNYSGRDESEAAVRWLERSFAQRKNRNRSNPYYNSLIETYPDHKETCTCEQNGQWFSRATSKVDWKDWEEHRWFGIKRSEELPRYLA
jgi:hypothetical protein